ncbi:hypothetical protein CASFOL_004842 [Castilleja foliolosa]|uniref:F-box protein n=1 Tax=Castilleja foliolosa TaxID=1961234 RepID=A0ABD3EBL9_9LAMI
MSQQLRCPVSDGKSKQSAQHYQPLWISHWMRTSGNNTSAERRNHSTRPQQLDRVSNNGNTKAFEVVNDDSLRIRPKSKAIDGSKIPASNQLSLRGFRFLGEGPSNSTHVLPHYNNNNKVEKYEQGKGKAADTSMNACLGDFDTFGREWFQKMQGVRLLPAQTEEDESNNDRSQFNLETMRICTTFDSVKAVPGGCPRFSQTTHSLLITKKTDVNQENDVYSGPTRLVKRTNENTSRDVNLSPFSYQGNRGVKLQPLSSSSNSQGRNNVRSVDGRKVIIRNESSAETDTMDMDLFKEEKLNYGASSTPSTKAFTIDSNSPPPIVVAPSREIKHRWTNSRLHEINLELPALPAVESPLENICPSSSKTQSLEMDMLVANAEHHAIPKPNLNSDPSNPWAKRLKMSSSTSSSHGTKISNPTENLYHEKMRRYFRSILDSSFTNSDPSSRTKDHGKETILSDKNGDLSKKGEGLTVATIKKDDKEALLSHVWIKRWLGDKMKVTKQKPDQTVEEKVSGSRDFKTPLDDDNLEKKQFPSIGAMAMMGKAMAGFQSCEVQKRGSLTVWNTKETF